MKADTFSLEEQTGPLRQSSATFSVDNELTWRTMNPNTKTVNRLHQGVLILIWDLFSSVPAYAAIYHVENNVFVDKQQISFNLFVELIRKVYIGLVVWARFGPGSTDAAGITYLWTEI